MTQQISGNDEDYGSCKVWSRMKIMLLCLKRSHGKYMCQQPR